MDLPKNNGARYHLDLLQGNRGRLGYVGKGLDGFEYSWIFMNASYGYKYAYF